MIFLQDFLIGVKKIPDNFVDIIIADPPYNIGKDFGNNKDNLTLEEYIQWSKSWINECFRVLSPIGTMYIYGFPEIIQYIGVIINHPQKWLFWHYTNKTIPSLKFWQRSIEVIIATWKDKPIFNIDGVREEYSDSFLKNSAGKVRAKTKGRFSQGKKDTIYKANKDGALPRDVLNFPALAGGAGAKERIIYCKDCETIGKKKEHEGHSIIEHPTQKPMALTENLIKASMNKNKENTILIPFCGSGTEVIVSLSMGQIPVAFEINKDYVILSKEKVKYYEQKTR